MTREAEQPRVERVSTDEFTYERHPNDDGGFDWWRCNRVYGERTMDHRTRVLDYGGLELHAALDALAALPTAQRQGAGKERREQIEQALDTVLSLHREWHRSLDRADMAGGREPLYTGFTAARQALLDLVLEGRPLGSGAAKLESRADLHPTATQREKEGLAPATDLTPPSTVEQPSVEGGRESVDGTVEAIDVGFSHMRIVAVPRDWPIGIKVTVSRAAIRAALNPSGAVEGR
jgi:hypothetical protein